MQRLIKSGYLLESIEGQNISYTLMAPSLFFDIGYKVLQSQTKHGYINCNITTHNGRQKLIYNVSGLKSYDALMKNITPKMFLNILCNLLDVVIDVKNNGFMQCENISLDFKRIFIDTNSMKVWLIYVPLNVQSDPNSYVYFETQLKKKIVDAINEISVLNKDSNVMRVRNAIEDEMLSIEQIRIIAIECMGRIETGGYSVKLSSALNKEPLIAEEPMVAPVIVDKKPEGKSKRFGLFRREAHTSNQAKTAQANLPQSVQVNQASQTPQSAQMQQPMNQAQAVQQVQIVQPMQAVSSMAKKNQLEQLAPPVSPVQSTVNANPVNPVVNQMLCLKGTNPQNPLVFNVGKEEFLIGKQKDAVDGLITSNSAISRIHCKVVYRTGEFYIVDMGSTNGTYLNRSRLQPNCPQSLHINDRIMIADCEFVVISLE